MTYYSVRIEGRKRKTRFKGSRHTVYKKLHDRGYYFDKKAKLWKAEELRAAAEQERAETEQRPKNILLLISIGDYKHVEFDIIVKCVFSAEEFKNLIERSKTIEDAHERIRKETIDMAAAKLRANSHYGLAKMLLHNTEIDYVAGGEYTWTEERPTAAEFTRFEIRNEDRLAEINAKRKTPEEYSTKQKKIEVD